MRVIAVVGSGSDSGKTTVACRLIGSIPGLGAVKISPRLTRARIEWGPGGAGKDTCRYDAAGAFPVARIVAPRGGAAALWKLARERFRACRGVVIEGAGAVGLESREYVVYVSKLGKVADRPGRDRRLLAVADCLVHTSSHFEDAESNKSNVSPHSVPGGAEIMLSLETPDPMEIRRLIDMVRDFVESPGEGGAP